MDHQPFIAADFITWKTVVISSDKVLEIRDRSSDPNGPIDHARVYIEGEAGLITLCLEDAKELKAICPKLKLSGR